MTELVTAAEMRAIEADAIASGAVTGLELMERAGAGAVEAILRHWPNAKTASVLCGPGNNGGDGYVIARLLAERGWAVQVFGMETKTPDALENRKKWEAMGEVWPLAYQAFKLSDDADVYVDAIVGTGLKRAPTGDVQEILSYLAGRGADDFRKDLVAIDAPSGLDMDTGRFLGGGDAHIGYAVPACALTVTFEVPKLGHVLADGPAVCGALKIVDLGLRKWRSLFRGAKTDERGGALMRTPHLIDRTPLVEPADLHDVMHPPLNFTKEPGHKYDHGHALILSGPSGHTGAARLAARAALRVGAGLVTVASPPNALMENAMHLTAVMTRRCNGADDLGRLLEDTRYNALCLGPGLGVGQATRDLVRTALNAQRMTVLDGDALTSFVEHPGDLFDLMSEAGDAQGAMAILTPHAGEFRRLFPDLASRWEENRTVSKVDVVQDAAARSGAVVLLKGVDTVIASPSGQSAIHCAAYDRVAPWLATAGSGDVLAGLITGLAARRYPLQKAAEHAAWLHVEAARAFGPGLIAEDLPEMVPAVLRDLER